MPTYSYICRFCDHKTESTHSMKESKTGELCEVCFEENALEKLPAFFTKFFNPDGSDKQERKPGDIVKEAIKELKKDLERYKTDLPGEDVLND